MKNKILALELHSESVCAALIVCGSRKRCVEYYAERPVQTEESLPEKVEDLLAEVKAEIDSGAAACVVSLPAEILYFRQLDVPFTEEKKIDQILPFELEPELPVGVDKLAFDFQLIAKRFAGDHRLMAIGVAKNLLQKLLNTIRASGFDPDIVTVGGYPIALYLGGRADIPKNWLLVAFGTRHTTLFIVDNKKVSSVRSFSTAPDSSLRCAEIQRTVMAYRELNLTDYTPECLYLTGFPDADSDMPKKLAAMFDIPVRKIDGNLFKDLADNENGPVKMDPGCAAGMLALCRLPLKGFRGFNFLKGPFAPRKKQAEIKKRIARSVAIASVAALVALFNLFAQINVLENRAAILEGRIEETFRQAFPGVRRIVDPVQQMKEKIKDERKDFPLPTEYKKQLLVIDVLNEISGKISRNLDVIMTKVVVSEEAVSVSGSTNSFNIVDEIKTRLETSSLFREVSISSANLEKKDNRINFKLRIRI